MRRLVVVILVFLMLLPLLAKKVGGVNLPDQISIENEDLVLNGAGLRKKVIIKVYACGLYLPAQDNSSYNILNAQTAINIRMHFIYNEVDQEKLITAWNEGFDNAGYTSKFSEEITAFNMIFNEPAKKDDIYDIAYIPGIGVQVTKNDVVLGRIEDPAFRKAVFSIWLGDNSALPKLKSALLGG